MGEGRPGKDERRLLWEERRDALRRRIAEKKARRRAKESARGENDEYRRRAANLSKLGYKNYSSYLNSPRWRVIRRKVIAAATCACCKRRPPRQVHHLDYSEETLLGERLFGLLPVCGGCHRRIEFHSNGDKRSFAQARVTAVYLSSRKRRRRRR